MKSPRCTLVALLLFATLAPLQAQDKKVVTLDDYGQFRRTTAVALSHDGAWMSYAYDPNEGDTLAYIQNLDTGDKHELGVASNIRISPDSKWAAYLVSPGEEETEKLQKAKKPIVRKAELINLSSGEKQSFAKVSSMAFSEDGQYLAMRKDRTDSKAEHDGADLLLRSLSTGETRNIGNVSAFAFNEPGDHLAYIVDADDMQGNGIYLLDLAANQLRPLDCARARYGSMRWNETGDSIALLRGDKPEKQKHRENQLLVFSELGHSRENKTIYDPASDEHFTEGMVISENAAPGFLAEDGIISIGIKLQEAEPEKKEDAPERPNVDVWHHQDEREQSVQQRRANGDRRFTYRAVFHLDGNKFLRLADEDMRQVNIDEDGRWGIGRDDKAYRGEITWGGSRADFYRVDLKTGERQLISKALGRSMGTSPDGRWFVFLKGGQVWSRDLDTGEQTNLTKASGVDFVNHGDDHPYEKPAYGVAGWTADGEGVILNHKFDLWHLALNGSASSNLTAGMGDKEQIRFRYARLDPEEDHIDLKKDLLLSAYGEWTKSSGYYGLRAGEEPQPLLIEDKSVGRPIKAKHADRIAMTMQTFVEAPDYYVCNTDFETPKKITDSNPQQKDFAWGRRILIDYENERGVPLQATLALPADYEEGKQYPMLVYFYEKMSQRHHQYSLPRFDDRPHMSTYASDGYLVLMPDVVYLPGFPGDCAVDCVTSATQKVIDLGYADAERIALQGHSWGGYQSSFILTQTDMFCAVVTGAPVTNLVSFYGELYKSSGNVQQGIVEVGQVRMGTTPFENMELYHSQSPLHNVENITTPFIILHGTEDGSVDWHQGLEYYNAAKRNGKEVILLSYPGEGHHLSKKPNQIDFQIRMKQFFDHYCKGTQAPDWMNQGVPFLRKDVAEPTDMAKSVK